jgi:formate hydrogenlyase subunit 3/multisubunit Na+/H+ antiporter MnhD subunit
MILPDNFGEIVQVIYICSMNFLVVFIIAAFPVLLAVPFIPDKYKGYAALVASLWIAVISSAMSVAALAGEEVEFTLVTSYIWGNIPFAIDPLSAWFILVVNLIVVPGVWYSPGYLRGYGQSANLSLHYVMLVWMHLSMIMVCMVQSGLAFLFVWELMSLSSFLLVIFDNQQRSVLKAGLNYLVQMHISVICLMVAFFIVYQSEDGFEFSRIGEYFATHNNVPLFLLFFVGFGFKAGIVPFHTWLPHAHPAAPSHVSGIMSGVIVKMGIYGIFRMVTFLQSDLLLIGNTVMVAGIVTGVYGILHASVQKDVKRLLAYCTVENVGLIVMGIGLGLIGQHAGNAFLVLAGYGSALFHVLNHALAKALLFFGAGAVYRTVHTRNLDRMGGLANIMPRSANLFLAGALAIAGLPPLNGFLSEFVLFFGFIKGVMLANTAENIIIILGVTAIALIGGLSVLTFTKTYGTMFLGTPRTPLPPDSSEPAADMRRPQYVLAAIMVLVMLVPFVSFGVVSGVVSGTFDIAWKLLPGVAGLTGLLQKVSLVLVMFTAVVLAVLSLRNIATRRLPERRGDTWGCGSLQPGTRMQYTGSSFTRPMSKLFGSLLPVRKNYKRVLPEDVFPRRARYAYVYDDWVEARLIRPVARLIKRLPAMSLHIQDGRLQWYIMYGLLFILAIILLTWLKIM